MASKARFVRGATDALVTGMLAAVAAGPIYFISLCLVDRCLAASARVRPYRAEGLDVNEILFRSTRQEGELLPGLVGVTAWPLR